MGGPKVNPPPRTWAIFRRNVISTLTWQYMLSYAVSCTTTIALWRYPDHWTEFMYDLGDWRESASMLFFFAVPFGLPIPAAWRTYTQMKKAGYRRIRPSEDSGHFYQFLLVCPGIFSNYGWMEACVPEYILLAATPWSLFALHLSDLWLFMYSPDDYDKDTQQQMVERGDLTIGHKWPDEPEPKPRKSLEWTVFRRNLLDVMKQRSVIAVAALTLASPFFVSMISEKDAPWIESVKIIEIAFNVVTVGPVLAGVMLAIMVPWKLKNNLKQAGYKEKRMFLSSALAILCIAAMKPAARYMMNPDRIALGMLLRVAFFVSQIWSVWIVDYHLMDEELETTPAEKDGREQLSWGLD